MSLLAGRYALAEPLGAGGMAQVVAATDTVLGRRVAVKLVRDSMADDPVVRERLLREARAAASLTHPNAVAVFDTGVDDGTPYIVMELVVGETLAARLRAAGALPIDEALRVLDDVLAALAAAHRRGLVHRDVKPANVLLPADGSGAKLADFGIAKAAREAAAGLTMTGQVLGTPRYLSPEQIAGEDATARSDLYAVGILGYELLTGAPPFDAEHAVSIALAHQRDAPAPLAPARPDAPAHVVAAIERALAKAPFDRFTDAGSMRAALAGAVDPAAARTQVLSPVPLGAATTQALPRHQDADPRQAGEAGPARTAGRRGALLVGAVALGVLGVLGAALAGSPGDAPPEAPPIIATDLEVAGPTEPVDDAVVDEATAGQPTPEPPPAPEPAPEPAPAPEPEPAPAPAPEPEPAAAPGPDAATAGTPAELLAALSADPDAAGKMGDDLRKKLADLLEEEEDKQPKKAADLIKESARWADKGDLRPEVAARTAELLTPIAEREKGDGSEGGPRGRSRP